MDILPDRSCLPLFVHGLCQPRVSVRANSQWYKGLYINPLVMSVLSDAPRHYLPLHPRHYACDLEQHLLDTMKTLY